MAPTEQGALDLLKSCLFDGFPDGKPTDGVGDFALKSFLNRYADLEINGTVPAWLNRLRIVSDAVGRVMALKLDAYDTSALTLSEWEGESSTTTESHDTSNTTDSPAETSSESAEYPFAGVNGYTDSASLATDKEGTTDSTADSSSTATSRSRGSTPIETAKRQLDALENAVSDFVGSFEGCFVLVE